ncbi:8708_t:CDS:2 [Funneliformis mosseae]|uniref:8708_t:CDS:1 n=1 Tax=Funneliformis mosseae TaxID=27381 RepID=A0A9N8W1G3_FUNMO|nr:8708_t:CDS:2 [Funneliformis mosseae]
MTTEESVLNSFLLNSELTDNLTLKQFINLFPIAYRKNSLIKTLYREFQLERNRIRETIKDNIVEECKKLEQ